MADAVYTGTIRFRNKRGFSFITPDGVILRAQDVYLDHKRSAVAAGLEAGARVAFTIQRNDKGIEAVTVQIIEGP